MRVLLSAVIPLGLLLSSPALADQPERSGTVGDDADEHGCRASAGYLWCEATGECERPWELAEREGFEDDEQTFKEFCEEEE